MEKAQRLAHRLREVILNGKLIANTNFRDALTQVTWEQATQQIEGLNTIAHLTFHVNYYIGGVLDVFEGGDLEIRDRYSFDLPPIKSQEDWEQLQQKLWDNTEKFAQKVEAMSDEKLASTFVKEEYGSYAQNVEVIIEHNYYHLGQVSLLRKLIDTLKK
ncbi:DUF1572 domain-containing protein [marine bacterium AO1-C]|nr:DUF1572 domain-containing protein [marine bacterium AO1-C]